MLTGLSRLGTVCGMADDTPLEGDDPREFPENPAHWARLANTPLFPSDNFGGHRGELWSGNDAGRLMVAWYMLSDGVELLRFLMDIDADAPTDQRREAIEEATRWTNGFLEWVQDSLVDSRPPPETDLADLLSVANANLAFVGDSIAEHVHRIGPRKKD